MVRLNKAKFGLSARTTLRTQADLGMNYRDAGRVDDAIRLLHEVYQKGSEYAELAWVGDWLVTTYGRTGKSAEAIALATERVGAARKRFHAGSPPLAAVLGAVGMALHYAEMCADAEPLLRECLSIRQQQEADVWTTFDTQSLLGHALLGQKKYAEAEPLLVQGYQGMKDREDHMPHDARYRLVLDLEGLVHLYDAWGKKAEADKWRKELEERKAKQKS
jgi:hypothetical protein